MIKHLAQFVAVNSAKNRRVTVTAHVGKLNECVIVRICRQQPAISLSLISAMRA